MTHHRGARGYTLVELSVLMVVFGIMAAITVVGTTQWVRTSRRIGATNTLLADLYRARALAANARSQYQIRFATDGYTLVRVSPLQTVVSRVAPAGVSFGASDTACFYPWGLVSPVTVSVDGCTGSSTLALSASGSVTRE